MAKLQQKTKLKHKRIIPLATKSFWTRFLRILVMSSVYLAGLSLMSAGVLERLANPMKFADKSQIFVHVFPETTDAKTADKTKIVIDTINNIDGVVSVLVVPKSVIQDLIRPVVNADDLPLLPIPIILNIKTNYRFTLTTEELKARLLEKTTAVSVESEVALLQRLTSAVTVAQGISWLIPLVGFLIICGIISVVVAGILLAYRNTLEVLYNLGAYRSTIVFTFANHVLKYSFYGGFLGITLAFITISIIAYFLGSFALLFPSLFTIILMVALPFLVGIVAWLISIVVINMMLDKFFSRSL